MLAPCQPGSQYAGSATVAIGNNIQESCVYHCAVLSHVRLHADRLMEVLIYTRPDCHLCHVALRIARQVQADIPFTLHSIDITQDTELLALYGHRIPVIVVDQEERLAGKMTERELRAALKKTRWSTSISRILSRLGWFPNRG